MKHLLVLVTVIAVFTADGRDFSNHPDGPDKTAANQEQIIPEDIEEQSEEQDSLDVSDGNNHVKIIDSDNGAQQMKKEEKEQRQRSLRSTDINTNSLLIINVNLLGTIVARFDKLEMELQSLRDNINSSNSNMNSELLSLKDIMNNSMININNSNQNLNSELESLKNKMDISNANLSSEMQTIKVNINNSDSNLGSELQSLNSEMQTIKVNMNNSDLNLGSELQSLKDNTNNLNTNLTSKINSMNTNINTKLASIAENQGCPDGFFKLSDQCFKLFTDSSRTWNASKFKCQAEGLLLAKPFNPLELRSYLAMRYGSKQVWLGGKGTGSYVKWDRDGQIIRSSNPMWYSNGATLTSSSNCLEFLSTENDLKSRPTTPYYMRSCTTGLYALCEYLMD